MRILPRLLLTVSVVLVLSAYAYAQDAPPLTVPASDPAASASGDKGSGAALIDKLILGGWTVGVQLIVSVAGIAFVVERLVNLRRSRIVPSRLAAQAHELWNQQRFDELGQFLDQRPSTLSRMLRAASDHRHASLADVSTVAGDIGARELKLHMQRAYPIAVVATLEPLLGLFGTVWGMIGAFDKVALMGEMGNASALSNEISLALVTTAVGLAIAIPMLAIYHYFRSKVTLYSVMLEEQVSTIINDQLLKPAQQRQQLAASASTSEVARAH